MNRWSCLLDAAVSAPAGLGEEVYKAARKKLASYGFSGADHAEEVFSNILTAIIKYAAKRGGSGSVRQIRPWVHAISRHEVSRYLKDVSRFEPLKFLAVVEGTELWSANLGSEREALRITAKAIDGLSPRRKELILLDMVERLPAEEIERRMKIRSHAYFLKLKCEAFSALKAGMKAIVEEEIGCLY